MQSTIKNQINGTVLSIFYKVDFNLDENIKRLEEIVALLEKGETDFSFTFIYKCAKACGVEVVDLLEGTSTTLSSFAITRKGEGLKILKKYGVEYKGYHSDAARTWGVGEITKEAQQLIDVTRQSFFEGMKYAKEGNYLFEISAGYPPVGLATRRKTGYNKLYENERRKK